MLKDMRGGKEIGIGVSRHLRAWNLVLVFKNVMEGQGLGEVRCSFVGCGWRYGCDFGEFIFEL